MRKYVLRVATMFISVLLVAGVVSGCGKTNETGDVSIAVTREEKLTESEAENLIETDMTQTGGENEASKGVEESKGNVQESDNNPAYMTTMEVTKDMGIGINLGNTLESCGDWIKGSSVTDYETAWGSPVITKDIIAGYAKEGFKTLRIPIAWSNLMGDNYAISPELINRVKEIVGWALEYDMYVIVNIHWDGGWWTDFPTNKEQCMSKYKAVWTQLAKEFAQYDHRLILESLNEEGCWDSVWNRYSGGTTGKSEAYALLNEINQTFVDLVRNSGYNNVSRHLLIAGYATDVALTCDEAWVMPTDAAGRCAVSVHYYTPADYCVLTQNSDWATAKITWGTAEDKAELETNMNLLKSRFIDKGVPVIIGEFGVAMDNKGKDDAVGFLTAVAEAAIKRDMCPVLWDTTSDYSFYNRQTCSMSEYPKLKENFNNLTK